MWSCVEGQSFGGRSYNTLEAKGLDEGEGKENKMVMTHQVCGWQCHFTAMDMTRKRLGSMGWRWGKEIKE